MHTLTRYVFLVLGILISIHFILTFTVPSYGAALAPFTRNPAFAERHTAAAKFPVPAAYRNASAPARPKANAALVVLARNRDLDGTVQSVREMEARFNARRGYPYVFLNEVPFTELFKQRITALTNATVKFGVIPREHWFQPAWIDEKKAKASREDMVKNKVLYGGSVAYRNMCRFNSGFFFRHPLLEKYRWYWRIEPNVHFHSDVDFDPFLFMEDNNKIYGFTISLYEFQATIPTLWERVKEFAWAHPEYIAPDNALGFLSDDATGVSYNLCHFWSNFEIADMEFWRSPAYTAFFAHLDATGGFYYERWGDAPVHSIAAALFAPRAQLHFFDEIGYEHFPYTHCPASGGAGITCKIQESFDYQPYSCLSRWDKLVAG